MKNYTKEEIMKKILTILILSIAFLYCGKKEAAGIEENKKEEAVKKENREQLTASVPPLKWLVQKIAGNDFEVISIIQPNMNHELFDPKPDDLKILENSKLFFTYNALKFEDEISETVDDKQKIVNLLENVDKGLLLENDHDHGHNHEKEKEGHKEEHDHDHGDFDPHVWFSLELMPKFAENIKNRLSASYPEKKDIFEKNYNTFLEELSTFKKEITEKMSTKKKKYFMSYHPTLGYFLKEYGITEVSVEYQGKEPSARQIGEIIEEAKEHGITTILVQPQFPKQSIDVISKEIPNARIIEFNTDAENVFENLKKFADSLE